MYPAAAFLSFLFSVDAPSRLTTNLVKNTCHPHTPRSRRAAAGCSAMDRTHGGPGRALYFCVLYTRCTRQAGGRGPPPSSYIVQLYSRQQGQQTISTAHTASVASIIKVTSPWTLPWQANVTGARDCPNFVSTPDPTAGLGRRLVSAGSIRHRFPAPVLAASRPVDAGVSPNLDLDGKRPETFRQEPAPMGAVSFCAFCTDPTLASLASARSRVFCNNNN